MTPNITCTCLMGNPINRDKDCPIHGDLVKFKLNKQEGKQEGKLKEMPGMEKPQYATIAWQYPHGNTKKIYGEEISVYEQHLASLKSFDIEKDQWNEYSEGQELSESDFVLQWVYFVAGIKHERESEWLVSDEEFCKKYYPNDHKVIARPKPSVKEKPDCSGHKKDLLGETDMKKVAEMIGDLHYETLFVLLRELSQKLKQDSRKDFSKNRIQLSGRLKAASTYIKNAYMAISEAWQISKPFMQSSK